MVLRWDYVCVSNIEPIFSFDNYLKNITHTEKGLLFYYPTLNYDTCISLRCCFTSAYTCCKGDLFFVKGVFVWFLNNYIHMFVVL